MRSYPVDLLLFILLSIVFCFFSLNTLRVDADTLYINGTIYTMDQRSTIAEAMAVRGTVIADVGTTEELQRRVRPKTIVDLKGKTVLPGFIDSHIHLLSFGVSKLTLDLSETQSEADAAALLAERALVTTPGRWIRGGGWDHTSWQLKRMPTAASLDRAAQKNPVFLAHRDGQAVWVNSLALQIAGITRMTPDPPGGKIIRDAIGNPTGVLLGAGIDLVGRVLPGMTEEERREAYRFAAEECLRHGITSVHDLGVDLDDLNAYKKMIERKELPIRVYAAVTSDSSTWNYFSVPHRSASTYVPRSEYLSRRLTVRAVHLYLDGSLESREAALIEPYSDDPGTRGITLLDEKTLGQIIAQALDARFQVILHATGDRAVNIGLNVMEAQLQKKPVRDHRFRIEQIHLLFPNDTERLKQLNAIAGIQPSYGITDVSLLEDRLGNSRAQQTHAWRTLLDAGIPVAAGSDAPIRSLDPLWNIYAASTRQRDVSVQDIPENLRQDIQRSGEEVANSENYFQKWNSLQKMSREEAVRSYSLFGARAAFQEGYLGSLEKGKLADFILLSDDIMRIDPKKILDAKVDKTYLDGEVVYERR